MSENPREAWPSPARPVDLGSSTFAAVVNALAEKHALKCTVRVSVSDHPDAKTGSFTRRITVTTGVLSDGPEEQAWRAAHEVGHLISARNRGISYHPWAFLVGMSVAFLLVFAVPIALLAALAPVASSQPFAARAGIVTGTVLLCWVAAIAAVPVTLRLHAAHQRPLEREADQIAKDNGYPVTRRIVDMLVRDEGPPSRWRRPPYREHLYPEQRMNVD